MNVIEDTTPSITLYTLSASYDPFHANNISSDEIATVSSNYPFSSISGGGGTSHEITFSWLLPGVYSDVTVTFTDIYGNASTVTIDTFTIENVVPEISDVHLAMFSSTAFFPQSLQFILKGFDPDFDPLSYKLISLPSNGTLFDPDFNDTTIRIHKW